MVERAEDPAPITMPPPLVVGDSRVIDIRGEWVDVARGYLVVPLLPHLFELYPRTAEETMRGSGQPALDPFHHGEEFKVASPLRAVAGPLLEGGVCVATVLFPGPGALSVRAVGPRGGILGRGFRGQRVEQGSVIWTFCGSGIRTETLPEVDYEDPVPVHGLRLVFHLAGNDRVMPPNVAVLNPSQIPTIPPEKQ